MKEQFEIKKDFKDFDPSLVQLKSVIIQHEDGIAQEIKAYVYGDLPVMSVESIVIEVGPESEYYVGYKSSHNKIRTNNILSFLSKYATNPVPISIEGRNKPLTHDEMDSLWQQVYNLTHVVIDLTELAYDYREMKNICHNCLGEGVVIDLDSLDKNQITFDDNLWELFDNPKINKVKCMQCKGTGYKQ